MNHFLQSSRHYSIPDLDTSWNDAGEVILVHSRLAPDELVFTEKMIQAFDWPGISSSHQVYDSEIDLNYQLLWARKHIQLVILFGIPPGDVGLNILLKPYQLTYIEPFYIYLTDPVDQLANHKVNKGKIWKDLKALLLTPGSGK
jgi:hypothetical protein